MLRGALFFTLGLSAQVLPLAHGPLQPPQVTTTEHVDFAPHGVVRVIGSYGDLYVQAWDQAGVEISVTKSVPFSNGPPQPERTAHRLAALNVKAERRTPTELEISTTGASRHVRVETTLQVPRNTRLVIHHGVGLVSITDIAGDIEASGKRGDILLWLSAGMYSIDARTRLGIVSSDFEGVAHRRFLVGQSFSSASPATATPQRLILRMGFGGITIKPILPESYPTSAPPIPAN